MMPLYQATRYPLATLVASGNDEKRLKAIAATERVSRGLMPARAFDTYVRLAIPEVLL